MSNYELFRMETEGEYKSTFQVLGQDVTFGYHVVRRQNRSFILRSGARIDFLLLTNVEIQELSKMMQLDLLFRIFWYREYPLNNGLYLFLYVTNNVPLNHILVDSNYIRKFRVFYNKLIQVDPNVWTVKNIDDRFFTFDNDRQIESFYLSLRSMKPISRKSTEAKLNYKNALKRSIMDLSIDLKQQLQTSYIYRKDAHYLKHTMTDTRASEQNREFFLKHCQQIPEHTNLPHFQKWAIRYLINIIIARKNRCSIPFKIIINNGEFSIQDIVTTKLMTMHDAQQTLNPLLDSMCTTMFITMDWFGNNQGHQTLIFINNENKQIKLFDPNGDIYEIFDFFVTDEKRIANVFNQLETLLRINTQDYSYDMTGTTFCFNRSSQILKRCAPVISKRGYCMWISLYIAMFSTLFNVPYEQAIQHLENMSIEERGLRVEALIGFTFNGYVRDDRHKQELKRLEQIDVVPHPTEDNRLEPIIFNPYFNYEADTDSEPEPPTETEDNNNEEVINMT